MECEFLEFGEVVAVSGAATRHLWGVCGAAFPLGTAGRVPHARDAFGGSTRILEILLKSEENEYIHLYTNTVIQYNFS